MFAVLSKNAARNEAMARSYTIRWCRGHDTPGRVWSGCVPEADPQEDGDEVAERARLKV